MTREPDFYRKLHETKFRGDTTHNYQNFVVLIGNSRTKKIIRSRTEAPLTKYHQKSLNSCCLSSLESAFNCIGDNRDVTSLVNIIEESLNLQMEIFKSIINFSNTIMKNIRRIKGEYNLQYNMMIWKKNDDFYILNDINEDVNLV